METLKEAMYMSQKLRKNKMENKIVNLFENAIQIDHLTNEQIEMLEKIFENYK